MRVLIAYSSGYGTTREVAEEVGQVLQSDKNLKIDIQSIDQVDDIAAYEGIVIGSSVRAEKALANIRDFISAHRLALVKKKFALFLVCLTANCQEGRNKVISQYIPNLLERHPQIMPISTQAFGGKIDFDKLNPVMQSLMRRVLEKTGLPTTGSIDTRDWTFIREWAHELKNKLQA